MTQYEFERRAEALACGCLLWVCLPMLVGSVAALLLFGIRWGNVFKLLALSLLLFALAPGTVAAPVPPAPRLTTELMTGTWEGPWAGLGSAKMTLRADGTCTTVMSDDDPCVFSGTWRFDGKSLTTFEGSFDSKTGAVQDPFERSMGVLRNDYPRVTFAFGGGEMALRRSGPAK